jgi:hypothetical protein
MVGIARTAKIQNSITIASPEYEVTAKMKTISVLKEHDAVNKK